MISATEALDVVTLLMANGIAIWLDGGWGVDALLGEQTRPHDDLDLVIDAARVSDARRLLAAAGFAIERDWLPTALALRDAAGRAVDLHPLEFSAAGGGDQTLRDGTLFHYGPPDWGTIRGQRLRCVSIETQVRCHLGYAPDADDRADMLRLADRFGLTLPAPYA